MQEVQNIALLHQARIMRDPPPPFACVYGDPFLVAYTRSLAEECTPLKQRYDSCFNLWFEGYLQPALDAAGVQRSAIPQGIPEADGGASTAPESSSSSSSASFSSVPSKIPFRVPGEAPKRPTSWAAASVFRTRPAISAHVDCLVTEGDDMVSAAHVHHIESEDGPLDTTGMTRSQIKAAQYERQCGRVWREYQGCLKKAISANQNLTHLLEQAREEHPLHSMDGLEGTAWDPKVQRD